MAQVRIKNNYGHAVKVYVSSYNYYNEYDLEKHGQSGDKTEYDGLEAGFYVLVVFKVSGNYQYDNYYPFTVPESGHITFDTNKKYKPNQAHKWSGPGSYPPEDVVGPCNDTEGSMAHYPCPGHTDD